MKVTVIGCGRWGSFLAWYSARLGHQTVLYGRAQSQRMITLQNTRTNGLVSFGAETTLSSRLEESVDHGEILIISIGAQGLRSFLKTLTPYHLDQKTIVLCMKGLEASTGLRLTQIVREFFPEVNLGIWVGPGHVQDFTNGQPNCMVIDSDGQAVKEQLIRAFSSDLIRFYYGSDLLGNEIGAASKNVIGIAAGMLDGMGKTALKGALMSRGTREIARLIQAMGGREITAYGLAHLGDYEATVFSRYSHNRQFGEQFVRHEDYGELAEGAATVPALLLLGQKYRVELPICYAVDQVIHHGMDPQRSLEQLFLRSLKQEF